MEFSEHGGDSGEGVPQTDPGVDACSDLCVARGEVYPTGLREAVSATVSYCVDPGDADSYEDITVFNSLAGSLFGGGAGIQAGEMRV